MPSRKCWSTMLNTTWGTMTRFRRSLSVFPEQTYWPLSQKFNAPVTFRCCGGRPRLPFTARTLNVQLRESGTHLSPEAFLAASPHPRIAHQSPHCRLSPSRRLEVSLSVSATRATLPPQYLRRRVPLPFSRALARLQTTRWVQRLHLNIPGGSRGVL